MSPTEIREEIVRLQNLLNKTPRMFKVNMEFYTQATSADAVERMVASIWRAARESHDVMDLSCNTEESD